MLRYSVDKKRREMTLDRYSDMSLAEARSHAATQMLQVREGQNPLALKKRAAEKEITTVNDLFEDWQKVNEKRSKHTSIPARIYRKDIQPHIGELKVSQEEVVRPRECNVGAS